MQLHVAEVEEAAALATALAEQSPMILDRAGNVVSFTWPAADADEPQKWDEDEHPFTELIFFLRAWSGQDPHRELTVLEERPVDLPEQFFRRAS